jgi:hypothetical protein
LQEYISKSSKKLRRSLPDGLVESEEFILRDRLSNLSEQIDEFIEGRETSKAWLVLGKVQSGKTSHLLGMVSYAATRKFALASLFTGVNDALNEQGIQRIQNDLSDACVRVLEVPTSSTSPKYQLLKSQVRELITARLFSDRLPSIEYPLPVLVTLKNPYRVKTLDALLIDLAEEFGPDLVYLMVDDEADQASQNGAANRQDVSATYREISNLRAKNIRHAMLAYTATPQAVLLSERDGLLRPDRCVTVPPKFGYFGLDDFLSQEYSTNLIAVDDVAVRASALTQPPASLLETVMEFLLSSLVRFEYPDVFYQDARQLAGSRNDRMKSVQLMVHESSAVKDHAATYHLVGQAKTLIGSGLEAQLLGTDFRLLGSSWQATLSRLGVNSDQLPPVLNNDHVSWLLSTLRSTKILIVNADKKSPTFGEKFPVADSQWEAHKTWILIGGDILGRGLTIPQLTASYFLRSTKKPNFDTVSQQMRFCGYRMDYAKATFIRAHEETIELFRYMQKIESAVWRYARKWDRHRTSLTGKIPPIMYAAPVSANLEPTRKNVRDPNLRDIRKHENSELLYSARGIFNPAHVYQNIKSLRDWYDETSTKSDVEVLDDWLLLTEFPESSMQGLIPLYITSEGNKQELRAIADLFDEAMGDLGLVDRPSAVYIRKSLIETQDSLVNPLDFWGRNSIQRAMHATDSQPGISDWVSHFGPGGNDKVWGSLKSPHVGESQRQLVRRLPFDGTVIVIEPITGTLPNTGYSPQALGLAFTIFKPLDFEIRMIGHA